MKSLIAKLLRKSLLEVKVYHGHKIPTGEIFHNDNINANGYNKEIMNAIDVWVDDKTFQQNPIEWVDVTKIVPTQKFLSKDNLEDVKGIKIGDNTGAYLVEYNGMYYVIDGHHRLANQIMAGVDKVKAHVQHIKPNKESIGEIYFMKHSNDRIKERINVFSDTDIAPNVKNQILSNIDLLETIDLNPKKSYGIMLGSFLPNSKSPYYFDVNGRGYYQIMDDAVIHDSTGNQFWVVVRENKATTVMLRKEIQTRDVNHNKEKLRVDEIIKDLPSYLKSRESAPSKDKFKKLKLDNGEVVKFYEDTLRFESLDGKPLDIDVIFDYLPEDLQNKILAQY